MAENPIQYTNMRRREFLRAVGQGTVLLVGGDLLAGCGSGASTIGGSQSVVGTVNRAQIGGNNLSISSVYNNHAVSQGGTVTFPVSNSGSQLQLVIDASNKIRAAAVSNPLSTGGRATITFDAQSTATALIFISPGILTVDSKESVARVTQIQALPSFKPLVTYLTQNLSTTTLNDLLPQSETNSLLQTCIDDFIAQTNKSVTVRLNKRDTTPQGGQFSASWGASPEYLVNVTNSGLRFVSVVQEKLLADLSENGSPTLLQFHTGLASETSGVLNGPSLLSWGNIITASSYQPATDSANVGIQNDLSTAIVRLWVYGPGFAGSAQPPPDVDALAAKLTAWGQSILYYIVSPVIDLVLGEAEVLKKGVSIISNLWAKVQSRVNIDAVIVAGMNGSTSDFFAALLDLVASILALIPPLLVALGIVVPDGLAALVAFLAISAGFFAYANLSPVVSAWASLPSSSHFDLVVSSGGITVQ